MVSEDPSNPNHSMSLSSQESVFSQSLSPWSNVKRRTAKGWFSWLVFLGWFLYFLPAWSLVSGHRHSLNPLGPNPARTAKAAWRDAQERCLDLGNHHQFLKLEGKKGGKKALHLPQKPWCEQQSAIPGSESKPKLSNHTYFFLCGAKSCSCQAIYLLSD